MNKYKKTLIVSKNRICTVRKYSFEYNSECKSPCKCGHSYSRHFDSYEPLSGIHCKYCSCCEFIPYEEYYDLVQFNKFTELLISFNNTTFTKLYEILNNHEILQLLYKCQNEYYLDVELYPFSENETFEIRKWLSENNILTNNPIKPSTNKFRRGRIINRKINNLLE